MASIGGLSSTGSLSSTSSLRGYGGLASGLDRDTLIEQLTYGTRTKIEQQQQKKQKLQWEQAGLRSIIDKAYDFTNKYTSYASSATNLTSSLLFSRTDITAIGENSKYISISGSSNSAENFSIAGIKQMAEDARITGGIVSDATLSTGSVKNDLENGTFDANMLAGKTITIKHGNNSYSVKLGSGEGYDYKNDLAGALNKSFEQVEISGDKKLSDVLEASVDSTTGQISFKNTDQNGNSVEITGGTGDVLQHLGFLKEGQSVGDLGEDALVIGNNKSVTGQNKAEAFQAQNLSEYLAGKTLTFNYNGTDKSITIGEGHKTMADLQNDLQTQLDQAFGKGRIKVELEEDGADASKLVFKTTTPASAEDKSSTLTIKSGDSGLLGSSEEGLGVFDIGAGASNRLDLSASMEKSGIPGISDILAGSDADSTLTINGESFNLKDYDSLNDLIKAVNDNEKAGVTISYQQNSDRFMITSDYKGASGQITLSGTAAEKLFGEEAVKQGTVEGKDAIVAVQYAGDSTVTEITRDSNAFSIDGLTVSLKGTFGYDENNQLIQGTEKITFDAKVDSENTTQVVKDMITAYNELLEHINKEVSTKPNRDYSPLTASQKEDMSESEIKEWEEKAKEGLFFNDTDLRNFASDLRFILPTSDRAALEKIGITVSSDYTDNGKLVFDESKFKAALEADPENVSELFTRKSSTDEDGNVTEAGLMQKITTVMERYTKTLGATKGILIERAGSSHAPTSVLQNSLQSEMDDIDDAIDRLLDRLEMEEERYISQFTALETLISQMNSQSSYLSQLSGGTM